MRRPSDLSSYPWLYLRDGEPWTSDEEAVELVAVGDVMLGRGVAGEPQPFAAVAPILRAADLTLGNLECVVTDASEMPVSGETAYPPPLRASSSAPSRLRHGGFDLLGLANNHALDLGPAGLAETASQLQATGIAIVGAGPDPGAAFQAVVREVDGLRLAFLAFDGVTDGRPDRQEGWTRAEWDQERVTAAVGVARDQADVVIVSVHWGYEYETRADPAQRKAAQLLFEAGVDLVIGHHPHVVQGFDVDEGRCVAYSLGNFVFDQGWGETGQGLALRVLLDRQGLRAVQALPVRVGPRSKLMAIEDGLPLLERLQRPAPRLAFVCSDRACRRIEGPPRASQGMTRSGRFWGGKIDLTGDGVPEDVRRISEQVVVYNDAGEAWRSPPPWRVVDVALGDPNDDGRGEVLVALWKSGLDNLETPTPEKERVPRSHPFIVGYRGGSYRTLWGGSAADDPIHEVELGDVDGDQAHELIVLDGDDPGERTVSVWRWHGWGFSLMWRSAPGAYRELSVSGDRIISVAVE